MVDVGISKNRGWLTLVQMSTCQAPTIAHTTTTQGGVNREGAFYVWTHAEVRAALKEQGGCSDEEVKRFCILFGIRCVFPCHVVSDSPVCRSSYLGLLNTRTHASPEGNVLPENDPHGEFPGQNVIHLAPGAQLHDLLPSSEWHDVAAKGLTALMRAREGRRRPHRVREGVFAEDGGKRLLCDRHTGGR